MQHFPCKSLWVSALPFRSALHFLCPCGETQGKLGTVDATSGCELNTCQLWLSSDQSSLSQVPLPGGNFATHVTRNFTFPSLSHCPSLSCFFGGVIFLINEFSHYLPGHTQTSQTLIYFPASCAVTHLPRLATPHSLWLTRPSCSLYLPRCHLAGKYQAKQS